MPFFSVVIPLYNKESYIQDTLDSVLNQYFNDFEVIIVNDGSTDNSLKQLEKYKDKRIRIIHQKNQGASTTRNNAINASTGKYIATLDADDLWKKDHLTELKKCIDFNHQAVLYCNNYKIKRHNGLISDTTFNFNYGSKCIIVNDFFKANIINFIPSSSSVAFKKSDFLKLNGYNKKLRSGQDIDLWIKFGLLGPIVFNPKPTMLYNYYDETSLSQSNYNSDRYLLIESYKNEELNNDSLKLYMDVNRYALAIRHKLLNEKDISRKIIEEIDTSNLNLKQKILLKLPCHFLVTLKKIQKILIKNKIYLSAFK